MRWAFPRRARWPRSPPARSVFREGPLPGAVLTRVAASLVRVGTFQYFAARDDVDGVRRLADYVIDRHYPNAGTDANPYLALLRRRYRAQAALIAKLDARGLHPWRHEHRQHGVSGETIDFGPCAFMDSYDPAQCSARSTVMAVTPTAINLTPRSGTSRDSRKRCCRHRCEPDRAVELATEVVARFSAHFPDHWLAGLRRKLGCRRREDGDAKLAEDLLDAMHRNQADFTLTFRGLCDAAESEAAIERYASFLPIRATTMSGQSDGGRGWRARAHAGTACRGHAAGQSPLHPAQPSNRADYPGCRTR